MEIQFIQNLHKNNKTGILRTQSHIALMTEVILPNVQINDLTERIIAQYSTGNIYFEPSTLQNTIPINLEINQGIFRCESRAIASFEVTLIQQENQLYLNCTCSSEHHKLCEHQTQTLFAILRRDELKIFFDSTLRNEKLRDIAADYGLENEHHLDGFFKLELINNRLSVSPTISNLISITKDALSTMRNEIILKDQDSFLLKTNSLNQPICVILKEHRYDKYLLIDLYHAQISESGKIKNPLIALNPMELILEVADPDHLKFFSSISKFQGHSNGKISESDILSLREIVKNSLSYRFYYHDAGISKNITANSIKPVEVKPLSNEVILKVKKLNQFYELSGSIKISGHTYKVKDLSLKFTYFLLINKSLYFIDKLIVLRIIEFLKRKTGNLLIHQSKFKEFKSQFLDSIQDYISIEYTHIKEANLSQIKNNQFDNEPQRVIYLSDFGAHVMIIPVLRYGEVEIPIRSQRQIYDIDKKGKEFIVRRNDESEEQLLALLLKQHQYFPEQLENDLHYFYLHKKHFLDEEWFLSTFEEWQKQNITVFGFDEIEGNKINPHRAKIDIKVISGINWFNALISVQFGKKKAAIKKLHNAIRNQSKYVQLDDGTVGIIPLEWIDKFSNYFNSGEISDNDILTIPKVNFSAIEEFYDEEMLDETVKKEIKIYREKLNDFNSIQEVKVPKELNGVLRNYQKEGLNWLNFLDDFNFGGCLADDMGLGKTIQIIAFILSQRGKSNHNTNLIVVPTTLIFNWQTEIEKFAPSIKVLTIYGPDRVIDIKNFNQFEIILISYNTLLLDIRFLKEYKFNYVFLDESQNIKNPETQRYKTVNELKSRNRIAITGTPIENNTFDLYSQLSFACPGLLGTKRYFRDVYSTPIDQFHNSKRATELQNKIKPFLLRRTKEQVATELPAKTEMILYCEMKPEQRKIYDAYENEFREYISAANSEELKKNSMNVLKGLTKLRQICNSPALLDSDALSGDGSSSKIEMLLEQIEDHAEHHKILIFSQFVSMLDLIQKELTKREIDFLTLTGKTKNREAIVNEFQNNPRIKIFLISLKAGGTGLNLTEANYVYLVDPWWNPAVENQAIDRSHRIGQTKNVTAIRLICPDTVEEKIMQMQDAKKHLAKNLITEDSSFLKSLSKESLLSLFQ